MKKKDKIITPFNHKRFLVWQHYYDPIWHLSDFLYYDKIIAPDGLTQKLWWGLFDEAVGIRRYTNLAKALDLLGEKGLLIQPRLQIALQMNGIEAKDIQLHDTNDSDWVKNEFDRGGKLRDITSRCQKAGLNMALKYGNLSFNETFIKGNNEAVKLIFKQLPIVDMNNIDLKNFVDFLCDEDTRIKRSRLFSWVNDSSKMLENGSMTVNHLSDLIQTNLDDYCSWMKKSDLKLKVARREIVFNLILGVLSIVKLPKAIDKYFEFKKLKIELTNDEKVSGRELAFIALANKKLKS